MLWLAWRALDVAMWLIHRWSLKSQSHPSPPHHLRPPYKAGEGQGQT